MYDALHANRAKQWRKKKQVIHAKCKTFDAHERAQSCRDRDAMRRACHALRRLPCDGGILRRSVSSLSDGSGTEVVHLGLGSNVGDRAAHIYFALDKLSSLGTIDNTSFLYETPPMYNTSQASFLNAAVSIRTSLSPQQLLRSVKCIERGAGRESTVVRNAPRPLDVDILVWGDRVIREGQDGLRNLQLPLQVPHARLQERAFALAPLHDISADLSIPTLGSVKKLLRTQCVAHEQMRRVTPLANGRLLKWSDTHTLLMGVVNATPDSFSDGGLYNTLPKALSRAQQFVHAGFDWIDVGGASTRPGAKRVCASEELDRVLPLLRALRASYPCTVLSIDTYESAVAKAVLHEGVADIINDISGGKLCSDMQSVVARTRVPVILGHIRGSPETMRDHTGYERGDVARITGEEVRVQIESMLRNGVRRWNIAVDGCVGFAKTAHESARLVANWTEFVSHTGNFPSVLGLSRKSWMRNSQWKRHCDAHDWATAGALGAALARTHVHVVRVHDPRIVHAVHAAELVRSCN